MNDLWLPHFRLPSPLEQLPHPVPESFGVEVWIKRDDLIHSVISGNKWRKLKYSIIEAQKNNIDHLVTFGGAFSNHLVAVAGICEMLGIKSTGIVRGEIDEKNPTLAFCRSAGMELIGVSRSAYRLKEGDEAIRDLIMRYKNAMLIPEGGTNSYAMAGVAEIIDELQMQMKKSPDHICLSAGTGGTTAGLLTHERLDSGILCFPALKSDHLQEEIEKLSGGRNMEKLTVINEFHFGGYAKWNAELLAFMERFYKETTITLEHVYTAKAMYGLLETIKRGQIESGSRIVFIHTGGLQGLNGLEYRIKEA